MISEHLRNRTRFLLSCIRLITNVKAASGARLSSRMERKSR